MGTGNRVLAALLQSRERVVVYGVNLRLTDAVLARLTEAGIKPACLCDGRIELAGDHYAGLSIIAPEMLAKRFPNGNIVICPTMEYWTVRDRLWAMGITQMFPAAELLEGFNFSQRDLRQSPDGIQAAMWMQRNFIATRQGSLFLPMVNIVLTERCSLNCRHCGNLMPYLKNKRDFSEEQLLGWMRRLTEAVDGIGAVHVIGGEALLHPDAAKIVAALASLEAVRRVCLVTNATLSLAPDVIQAFKATTKAHVFISNYGALSRKAKEIREVLAENGVPCDEQPQNIWRDMGNLSMRGRTREENQRVFNECIGKNCGILLGGALHRCSRSAFGARLKDIPNFPQDYVDLTDGDMKTTERRGRLQHLFFTRNGLDACDYCDGVRVSAPSIKAAEQA